MTAPVVVITLAAVTTSVFAWRGFGMELTPAGVYWRSPLFRRLVPWEALAPGGPPRPQIHANRLHLAVARPELVRQRGLALGFGPRQRPVVPLQRSILLALTVAVVVLLLLPAANRYFRPTTIKRT